jgi:activator of HSP90 ATPase
MEKIIRKTYVIKAPVERVWKALVSPALIRKWSGSKAIMSPGLGQRFELWNGDIYGKNIDVEKNKRLVQEWYSGPWVEPSLVFITLSKIPSGTKLRLVHKNVPLDEILAISSGWDDYYFGMIKDMLER